ncbi:hypothetical protein H9Q70_011060 [Fusarium xylarioides]|nr:hypothetical protein H9Q70_011060 [Fusarium xylarioides]KAG5777183.1 hypothetical protein H9Q73_009158 [Fusarium xylarioides]
MSNEAKLAMVEDMLKNDKAMYIEMAKKAMLDLPEDDPNWPEFTSLLGKDLFEQWQRVGLDNYLKEAISYTERAVAATPESDIDHRLERLANLASMLATQADQSGDLDTLDIAISKAKDVISLISKDHSMYNDMLRHLGNMFFRKYEQTGNLDAMQFAMLQLDEALSVTPRDHPSRGGMLSSHSAVLYRHYELEGNTDDLKAAISCATEAVARTAKDDPNYWGRFSNLGSMLAARYSRTGTLGDLEAAIENKIRVISSLNEGHYQHIELLNDLGAQLLDRYEHTKAVDDLESAIAKTEQALALTPAGHPLLPIIFNNLSNQLATQYEKTDHPGDLERAILFGKQAVTAIKEDHPNKAGILFNLGNCYLSRYRDKNDVNDLIHALVNFDGSVNTTSARPLFRVRSARKAFRIVQHVQEWEWAAKFAQKAIELLPSICGRQLNREDQQRGIIQAYGLAADACSVSLLAKNVEQALQQVEFGRGVILSNLIDSRSDVSMLDRDYPDLAAQFRELREMVFTPVAQPNSDLSLEGLARNRRDTTSRFEECLGQIRQSEGYEGFLLPPTVKELQRGASEGPIVIVNVTDISSDAIIVSKSSSKSIRLPEMNAEKSTFLAHDLRLWVALNEPCRSLDRELNKSHLETYKDRKDALLSWLWTSCVGPILDEVKCLPEMSVSVKTPRIWWIGTGVASSLPFHAAKNHAGDPHDDALHQVISSYTPTIKSLIHARSCASGLVDPQNEKRSVLLVAMPKTPGEKSLPGVIEEVSAVQQALGESFSIQTLQYPSVKDVVGAMKEADILHFACHGFSDYANPSESHLLLQGTASSGPCVERLTLQKISDEQASSKAQIAYLSACSTAEVKAKLYADEGLHIVSAFQAAGFGHVIGSLWAADDRTCVEVARYFYEYLSREKHGLVTSRAIAEGLREAILKIRQGRDAGQWAPFMHSGA